MADENQVDPQRQAKEKALERARALLNQAQHAGTGEDEARVFTDRAMDILARHGLDEAMLEDGKLDPNQITELWIELNPPYVPEQFTLLNRIAKCLGGHAIVIANDSKTGAYNKKTQTYKVISLWSKGARAHVIGFKGDLDRINFLFTYLLAQATAGMVKAKEPPGKRRSDYLSTWLQYFSSAIYDRLWKLRQRAQRDTDRESSGRGTELVLADRNSLIDAAFNRAYPTTETISLYKGTEGRSDGYRAGLEADLDQTKVNRSGQHRLPAGTS